MWRAMEFLENKLLTINMTPVCISESILLDNIPRPVHFVEIKFWQGWFPSQITDTLNFRI